MTRLLAIAILLCAPAAIANEPCVVQGRIWFFDIFVPGVGVRIDGGPWHYTDELGWYSIPVCSGAHTIETHWSGSGVFDDSKQFGVRPRMTATIDWHFPKGK